jgi:anti-anti-sigma regulatory factor
MERPRDFLTRLQDRVKRFSSRIVVVPNGQSASILVFGAIDDDASQLIDTSVRDLLKAGVKEVRVDLANSDRIEPAGAARFRLTLAAAEDRGARAVFVALSETIARQLRRAGIIGHIELEGPFAS